jgi:cell wall-associated NlpC family hydrolase
MNSDDYIRIPFKELGRSRDGVDCWGLVCLIYKEQINIELPHLLEYSDTKDRVGVTSTFEAESRKWSERRIGEEKPYDVAAFNIMGQPMHVGLVVKPGLMIHAERGCGVYLTNYRRESQWSKRLKGFFSHVDYPSISTAVQSA